jgi:hypothetical protein
MTKQEWLAELKLIAATGQPERALALVLRSVEAFLECTPMRSDSETQAIASLPGAGFVVTLTTSALTVDVRAGERAVTVFRRDFDAPAEFGDAA